MRAWWWWGSSHLLSCRIQPANWLAFLRHACLLACLLWEGQIDPSGVPSTPLPFPNTGPKSLVITKGHLVASGCPCSFEWTSPSGIPGWCFPLPSCCPVRAELGFSSQPVEERGGKKMRNPKIEGVSLGPGGKVASLAGFTRGQRRKPHFTSLVLTKLGLTCVFPLWSVSGFLTACW